MIVNIKRSRLVLCIIIVMGVISSCTLTKDEQASGQQAETTKVWPQTPAKARIAYVKSFTSASDLGIRKGFFAQILDFFTGREDWQLVRPMAVLTTDDGKIFVGDPGARAVHRFDPRSGKYTTILRQEDLELPSPVGLALGAKGELYIADSYLGQVYVVPDGSEYAVALEFDVAPERPTNIAVDQNSQRLYVVDSANHNIKVYGVDGLLLYTIGRRGSQDGEFNFPSMIWLDNQNRLLVSDALNFRIQVFDLDGRFIKKFGQRGDGTGDMSRPKGVATDSEGHIYVVDALFHSVQLFNSSGKFLLNVGRRGNTAGEFLLPTGIFINHDNMIYVADSHNSRIQIFRYIGDQ